jgi:hypothetical protein
VRRSSERVLTKGTVFKRKDPGGHMGSECRMEERRRRRRGRRGGGGGYIIDRGEPQGLNVSWC